MIRTSVLLSVVISVLVIGSAVGVATARSNEGDARGGDPENLQAAEPQINNLVADTVQPVIWDTITEERLFEGLFSLTVSNHGNAGNSGLGRVNMDFVGIWGIGKDCTIDDNNYPTEDIYLCDLTPLVMIGTGEGEYSWQPFHGLLDEDYHFRPVPGHIESESVSTVDYDSFISGTFVTSDSSLGFVKQWFIPDRDQSFVVECWRIFSFDGLAHEDVWLGEWIDWDIPSGTGGNEGGFVLDPGGIDYFYQKGIVDPEASPPPCLAPNRRLGASGFIGYRQTGVWPEGCPLANPVGLHGGAVVLDEDLFVIGSDVFNVDSVWTLINREDFTANNSADADQQIMMSFGQYDIPAGDTLYLYTVHASVYDGDEVDLQTIIDDAVDFYEWDIIGVGSAGCGNYDYSRDCVVDESDLDLFTHDFFNDVYYNWNWSGELDYCEWRNVADLVIFNEFFRRGYDTSLICQSSTVDCNYAPGGDTVRLVAVQRPTVDNPILQLDLMVRCGRTIAGAQMGFMRDYDGLEIDSAVSYTLVENAFTWLKVEPDAWCGEMPFIAVEDPSHGLGLPGHPTQYRRWASYYFTATGWQETDSIVFEPYGLRMLVRSPYDGSPADSLGYEPAFDGPLVIYDANNCCGQYTGSITGNCNCSRDGKLTLADITKLIDHVYITKEDLCCPKNGNTNASWDYGECLVTLSDITRLIDAIYISKTPPRRCLAGCN